MRPVVVSVVGQSGSGKTTLAEALLHRLSAMGVACGALKAGHAMDLPRGKDTTRLGEAGARVVVGVSPGHLLVWARGEDPWGFLGSGRLDVVVAEGWRGPGVDASVVLGEDERPVPGLVLARVPAVRPPVPEDLVASLLAWIEARLLRERRPMVELEIDGRKIPLNEFVARLLEAQVRATVSQLKGGETEPGEIVLRVTRQGP